MKYYSSLKEAYAYVEQRMEQRFWNPSEHIFTYHNGDSETMITEDTDDNTLLALIKMLFPPGMKPNLPREWTCF